MSNDLFGVAFDLPSFTHPDSYRRNEVSGPIPSPTLLTEPVPANELRNGDVVLFIGSLWRVNGPELLHGVEGQQTGAISFEKTRQTARPVDRVRGVTFGLIEQEIPLQWLRDDSIRYYGRVSAQHEDYASELAMDADETCGNTDEIGWHAALVTIKYRGTITDGATGELIEYGRDSVLWQWAGDLPVNTYAGSPDGLAYQVATREAMQDPAGFIVTTNDQGFVYVCHYATLTDLERAWQETLNEESATYTNEWTRCGDCYRAMRTQPDSYSWKMSGAFMEDACEYFCTDCLLKNLESSVSSYEDNPHTAITWLRSGKELEDIGYVQWEPHNPHTYESGWHPGQNDNPEEITKQIRRDHMHASIVFVIDSTGQFDMRFSAWVKFDQDDEEQNDRDEAYEAEDAEV